MDTLFHILNIIGALGMLGYGLTSFFAPAVVAKAVSQTLNGPRGKAEFRIGNGGFFTAMPIWALTHPSELGFQVLGIAWLGGALARLIAAMIDKPEINSNYIGLFFLETTMGVFLFL